MKSFWFWFLSDSFSTCFFFLQQLNRSLPVAVQTSETCYIFTPSTRSQKDSGSGCRDDLIFFITLRMLWHRSAEQRTNVMWCTSYWILLHCHYVCPKTLSDHSEYCLWLFVFLSGQIVSGVSLQVLQSITVRTSVLIRLMHLVSSQSHHSCVSFQADVCLFTAITQSNIQV